jgi:hypothetical protein
METWQSVLLSCWEVKDGDSEFEWWQRGARVGEGEEEEEEEEEEVPKRLKVKQKTTDSNTTARSLPPFYY